MTDYPNIFSPLTIKGMTLRNRICSTGHMASWMHHNGLPNDRCRAYFEERARGGIALVTLGATSVREGDHPAYFQNLDDRFIASYRTLTQAVHRHGARFIAQFCPRGAQVHLSEFCEPVPSAPVARVVPGVINPPVLASEHVASWSAEDLEDLAACCGRAAWRARAGGADGVELHAHQHHLYSQFLSPACNRRDDAYGGSFSGRARLLVDSLTAMRQTVGEDFVVGVRLKAHDMHPDGCDEQDCVRLIELLQSRGLIDYVSLTVGAAVHHTGSLYMPEAAQLDRVARVRRAIDLPVFHAGGIVTPEVAEAALAEGCLDVVGITKGHFADAHFVNKLRQGRRQEIRLCIRCQFCCDGGEGPVGCIYNPVTGREKDWAAPAPASVRRRVVIVGAGPAGMEAAITASERGHDVIVLEKESRVGGQVWLAGAAPLRRGFSTIAEFYQRQAGLGRFEVRSGVEATAHNILALTPDAVILATGSMPVRARIDGYGKEALTVPEVLAGKADGCKRVLVVDRDGHAPAFVAADHLRCAGVSVTFVAAMARAGADLGERDAALLCQRLAGAGVNFIVGYDLLHANGTGATLRSIFTDEEQSVGPFDETVVAAGSRPRNSLATALEGRVSELHVIGAASASRFIFEATTDGVRTGHAI
ncbi:MAG: FAD-dependent oxidoreductase [Caldilineaceae bacterium]|nr:FAD-dependent oxidoreductase [Caldilineaceae bacterium]